jgi:putative SOS response-associated peptidase YedK
MCGRFTLTADFAQIMDRFGLAQAEAPIVPRYNIAPTQPASVVLDVAPRTLSLAQWGLLPTRQGEGRVTHRLINARAETLAQKPTFRRLLSQRCLVLADGFYEWRRLPDGTKQPMRITLSSGELFAMAGLWETHRTPDGRATRLFVIITTAPNALVAPIHDRMPAILPPALESDWLAGGSRSLAELRRSFPADQMIAYPVSPRVNSVRFDDPSLIQPAR